MKSLFFLGIALLVLFNTVSAQPEIVPAEHEVYDFLHLQRVHGLLPNYLHESRPIARDEVIQHLETLQNDRNRLGKTAWQWLQTFRQAFLEPEAAIETMITPKSGNESGKVGLHFPLGKDTEKFLFYKKTADWRTAVQGHASAQFRGANPNGEAMGGFALVPELIIEGHYKDWFGFYSGTYDGVQLMGNTRVQKYDPQINTLYYILYYDPPIGSYDRSSTSIRLAKKPFFIELANERLIQGASFTEPIVLGGINDYYSFVRLGFRTKTFQYQMIHANLSDLAQWEHDPDKPDFGRLVSPQRYLAMHRLNIQPSSRFNFSFYEMVVYGLRSPELAYLNPFNPVVTSEHALGDRDNSLFAMESVVRPIPKIEAFASLLVDDMILTKIGKHSYNVKWAFQTGVGAHVSDHILASLSYTRVDPFTYTHRFPYNGSFYNAYQHNQTTLGHPIGPNADQWKLAAKMWFPKRIRAEASLAYTRQGENYTDDAGKFVNVGGDPNNGLQTGTDLEFGKKKFLAGQRDDGFSVAALIAYEPIRNISVRFQARYNNHKISPDVGFFRTELVFGF